MSNSVTYDIVWQVAQKEKQSNELQSLPKSFYEDLDSFIRSVDASDETGADAKKNAARLANEIYERRKQKILLYVAYKRALPSPTIPREMEFYESLKAVSDKNVLSSGPSYAKPNATLKLMQDIPEIILPSGGNFGPFAKGQAVDASQKGLSKEDMEFLVSSSICQMA